MGNSFKTKLTVLYNKNLYHAEDSVCSQSVPNQFAEYVGSNFFWNIRYGSQETVMDCIPNIGTAHVLCTRISAAEPKPGQSQVFLVKLEPEFEDGSGSDSGK